ncbi:SDR family NAD(P)-dependent oxidoreductase [Verrucomicrobiota bacterium]
MDLKGKTALVTGGGVRIGRVVSEALAARGCHVAIHCNRSGKQASSLAARLRRLGVRAFTVKGDFRTSDDCRRVVDQSLQAAGRLDILINNAAVFRKQRLLSASEADIRHEFEINLLAPLWLIRAFASRARKGRVLNLLDRRITSNAPGMLPYLLSKKGLADLTKLAALELAPSITVNGVAPGPVLGPAARAGVREKAGRLPLGRKPTVKDLVQAVMFLLECDSITGQVLFVDSGQHLLGSEVTM